MKYLNKVLLQLSRAVELANSDFPQEKDLAVILLDNLIEIQLFKKAELSFQMDSTTWYSGRRTNDKIVREGIVGNKGNYNRLLKFSRQSGLLSEAEIEILSFAHEIRNKVYHQGQDAELRIELALLLYYSFFMSHQKSWSGFAGIIGFVEGKAYQAIQFGSLPKMKPGELLRKHNEYFEKSVDTILGQWQLSSKISETAEKIISDQIRQIRRGIDVIRKSMKDVSYYGALGIYSYLNDLFFEYEKENRKPKDIDSILIISSYVRHYKDQLDDIDDLETRRKKGRFLLKQHRRQQKGKYSHWVDLDAVEKRVQLLKGKSEHATIKSLIEIQSKLYNLYMDVEEAAQNFDGHIEHLTDVMRGK